MTISTNGLNTNDKKAAAVLPRGDKKKNKKKKKKAAVAPDKSSMKTYEQVTDQSFIMNPADWHEAADEMSFDDINAALVDAMHNEYDSNPDYMKGVSEDSSKNAMMSNGGGMSSMPYSGSYGSCCRYYLYKAWPDQVVFKRSYDNKSDDPLFMMHTYTIEGDEAMLGAGVPVSMGFVPAGAEPTEFMTAMREADEISVDDPQLAELLAEDEEDEQEQEDGPEDEEGDDDIGDGDDDADDEAGDDEEEEDVQESALREDIANLQEQDFREQFENAIDGSCRIVESKNGSFIIENMAVIGLKSKNGRTYPAETRKRALKIFEGAKAYANHPKKGEENHARGVTEAIGVHRNVYYDPATDMVRSNLHLSPTSLVKGYIIPHAKANPSIIGNSINGGGKLSSDGTVMEITKISSIDLVTDPATTNGLFESTETRDQNTNSGGKIMTLKELLENKELVEEARNHFREELEVELSVSDLQEENETLKEELAEYKLKEQQETKRAEIQKLLKESKLPEESKIDQELFEILEEASPERRASIIARLEKVAATAGKGGPAPSGMREKELTESITDRSRIAKGLMAGLVRR